MKVIIAEKPSVAREIALIVGAHTKQEGYIEGNGYTITWALGHLVSLSMPEVYGANGFNRENLPIMPEPFQLKVRQEKSDKGYKDSPLALKQLKIIKQLFNSCDSIIVATDAGREGELIFRYIYHYLHCTKPFVRLWISSLTEKAIREGLDNLKNGTLYDNLYLSAKARSEADWLIGINATQALTIAAGEGTYSLGRVQTPTLMMICNRYLDNKNFVSTPYWQVKATIEKNGIQFSLLSKEKYSDKCRAETISLELMDAGRLIVQSVVSKEVLQEPPLLYDLTNLQKEMNSKHGFSAEKTLSVAQKLYESKYITYPRTGSRYISEDILPEVHTLLTTLVAHSLFGNEAATVANSELNKRTVDDSKVTDHHALLITENIPKELSNDERIIYDSIAGRIIEAFGKPSIKQMTSISAICGETKYQISGSIVKSVGWRKVFNETEKPGDNECTSLPHIEQGEELYVSEGEILQKATKPKSLHTESSLLSAMETAGKELENDEERLAMKESGIGTPATRAAIIETLFTRDYIRREKKSLVPTFKGMAVYDVVKDKRIADVQMTGMWEATLANIEKGKMNADTFGQGIRVLAEQITSELLGCTIEHDNGTNLVCPKCGATKVLIYEKVAKCRNVDCSLTIFRNKCGKLLTDKNIADLLTNRKTGIIKGFKSKEGKSFDATLVLDDSFDVQIQFPKRKK